MSDASTMPPEGTGLSDMERLDLHTTHVNLEATMDLFSGALLRDDHEQARRVLGFMRTLQVKHETLHGLE